MEDNEITELFFARSERAIAETDKKYGRLCHTLARSITNDPSDAEECTNDAYEALWNSIPPARPDSLKAFLCRTVRNIAFDRYEKNTAKKRGGMDNILAELDECVPSKTDAGELLDAKETAKAISEFLRSAGKEERGVFIRRYWYARPLKDIASELMMSESKVKSMLHRTRAKLKEYLIMKGITP